MKNEEVDEFTKETNVSLVVSEPIAKSTDQIKKPAKSNITSKPPKKETGSTPNDNYLPNLLIAEELDIEGVKKMTEKGNKVAMLGEMGCNLFYSSVSL